MLVMDLLPALVLVTTRLLCSLVPTSLYYTHPIHTTPLHFYPTYPTCTPIILFVFPSPRLMPHPTYPACPYTPRLYMIWDWVGHGLSGPPQAEKVVGGGMGWQRRRRGGMAGGAWRRAGGAAGGGGRQGQAGGRRRLDLDACAFASPPPLPPHPEPHTLLSFRFWFF